jgi:hypothetical protein
MGAAGDVGQIGVLIDELKKHLERNNFKTELGLRQTLDDILCKLFRKYDVERSERLGFQKIVFLFEPPSILGAKLEDGAQYHFVALTT